MNFAGFVKKNLLPLLCLGILAGCAAQAHEENSGVQDIQPGEQSVIQPPSHQAPATGIEERSL